jgi:hypothetical protein
MERIAFFMFAVATVAGSLTLAGHDGIERDVNGLPIVESREAY